MYDKQKVIGWALGELGYHEGSNNWNKYAQHIDSIPGFYNGPKQNQMWCDVFVDDGFVVCYGAEAAKKLLCQPDYSCGAGCKYSAEYFQQHGQYYPAGSIPEMGDQIFFSYRAGEYSHTGIVVEVKGNTVITVEGNTSDMVAKRSYSIFDDKICGYGRPDWSIGGDDPEPEPTPEPQPTPKPDYHYHKTTYKVELHLLKLGDYGPEVMSMQGILNAKGFECPMTGVFDEQTRSALMSFQGTVGIAVDGEYGGHSMSALRDY